MSKADEKFFRVAVLVEFSREYARGLLRGINRFALERGNWSIIFEVRDLDNSLPGWLAGWKGDGVIARINDRATARALRKLEIPVIDLRGAIPNAGIPFIGVNNGKIAYRIAEHLLSLGLDHYAFYARPRGENRFQDERCDQFTKEIRAAGHDCHVFNYPLKAGKAVDFEEEQQATIRWLRSLPKPVGIMAPHDTFGHQLLVACREAGIEVPGEVAIASVDNDAIICTMGRPTLTSIHVASDEIGYQAAFVLNEMMHGRAKIAGNETLEIDPGEIIPRESTRVIGVADAVARQALMFIRDHAAKGITVKDVLAHVGASQRGLERKLKVAIGRTPNQEITRVRVTLAKQLLTTTKMSLQTIAERCGFGSYKYFSDAFQKSTGKRPSTFRSCGDSENSEPV